MHNNPGKFGRILAGKGIDDLRKVDLGKARQYRVEGIESSMNVRFRKCDPNPTKRVT